MMNPRERAVTALALKQPDIVPHFELEMQLTEEYFGKHFSTKEEWEDPQADRDLLLRRDAELLIETANHFSYCIIFYSNIYRPTEEDYLRGIEILHTLDNKRHLLMAHGDCTLSIPDGNDMERMAYDLFDHGSKILDDQRKRVDESIVLGERRLKAGLDGFILCSDYCFNAGPFLSPTMFSEFVTPFLKDLIAGYKELGAYVIKHTDGNIMPIIDQLIETKPDGLHSLDPMAGVDIKEVKERYGDKVCLIGNVNCALLQTGTEEEILTSCRYAMENGKRGGGYIFATSNVVFKGMPKKSYDLMLEYYRGHNRYDDIASRGGE